MSNNIVIMENYILMFEFYLTGRISLSELVSALDIDYIYISAKAKEIVEEDKSISLVLGQLVNQ